MTTDIRIAQQLFGPHLAFLKDKTTQSKSPAARINYVDMPNEIYERKKLVLLMIDIMSVNGLWFLITVSEPINLVMTEYLSSMAKAMLCVIPL